MAEKAVLATLGWVAAPMIKMLIEKASEYLGTGMKDRKKKLAATVLPRLSLAIEKAEKSPHKEKLVEWLTRLKGAYYEAEETIDLFQYKFLKEKVRDDRKTLELKEKSERGSQISLPSQIVPQKLKDSLSIFSQKKILKLKSCIDKLIEIAEEANEFRDLLEDQENGTGSDPDRDTGSEPPSKVFGREKDRENIVGLLTKEYLKSEPGPFPIILISITGRSGIGKTTLAQYVYNYMDEQDHFHLCVWVHAPRKFKATNVIKSMIRNIEATEHSPNNNPSDDLQPLLLQIRRMLGSKKLLLILDDFWSDTEDFVVQWEKFIGGLSRCLPGSRILLTTQSINVAKQASLANVTEVKNYYLHDIEDDQFSKLFMHYACPSNSRFEIEGKKIAMKLKGDPGAGKLVGHQLSGKHDLRHWEEVAEKDWFGDNMKARIWSYQQLPRDLQRCFALCSLFPKGFMLQRQFLINLWMAEGFIRPRDMQEKLEDIGENYLRELTSRFFIEEVVDNKKGELYYQLHDLLHDLAEHVQGDDFIRIDSFNSREIPSHISNMLSRSENIRHILLPSSMINELKETLCLMKNIRTFFVLEDSCFVPKKVLQEILKHLEKLRVLDLSHCVDELPDYVGNLKHLRYLDIYGSRPIKKLPDAICKLYHLQTLVLPNCRSLPNDFSELISLRCISIRSVGETMFHISNVGRLTSLQCLDQFLVRKERGNELHQLENLNQLRGKMRISGLENVRSIADAVKANMQNKKHLDEVEFEWKYDERDTAQHVQLLDALQPHPNISALTLKGFGGDRLPSWTLSQNSLKHLTSLTLMNCDKVEKISSIDKSLPNCRSLQLCWVKNLKEMPSLPPNLTYLVIHHLPQLTYFSKDDLSMTEERKQSKLEGVKQIEVCWPKFKQTFSPRLRSVLLFVKERLKVIPEICNSSSQYRNSFSEIVKFDPYGDYSGDQLLDAWVMCMRCYIETMFNKNEESNLILLSSLTHLKISSCSITSDALSTSIQCLVSLCELKLSNIQTIISLPPKEVLISLKNLKSLTIEKCFLLSSLGGIGAVTSLKVLKLNDCYNLNPSNEPLPSSLETLELLSCSNVDVITCSLDVGNLSHLKELHIGGWVGRLEGLNSINALHSLSVVDCPGINSSPPMDKYTSELHEVTVDNLFLLKLILSNESISSIKRMTIISFQGDSSDDEVFQSLTSLTQLSFCDCEATHLPKNLKNLASVVSMELYVYPNLCELELEELPRNLRVLQFISCPNLSEKVSKGGPYRVRIYEGITILTFPTEEGRKHL